MKSYFYKNKPIVGLEINPAALKIMAVNAKKWTVNGYGSLDVDPEKMRASLDSDGAYLGEQIRKLVTKKVVGNIDSNRVVMSIPASRSFSRSATLAKDLKGSIREAIIQEADQYIPVPVDQLNIDYEVIGKDESGTQVHISAAPSKLVEICIKAAESAGLQILVVETSMSAVARILRESEQGELPTIIVDIGTTYTDVAVLDGIIKVTDSTAIGGETFTASIAQQLNVKSEKAHQLKVLAGLSPGKQREKIHTAVSPHLDQITAEVKKITRYYTERVPNAKKIEQVIIIGGGSSLPGIGEYFTEKLELASRVASPWQKLNFAKLPQPARQFKPRYITVAGLALVNPQEILR